MFLSNLKYALSQPVVPPLSGDLREEELDEIVGAQSHGNIWLQWAQFYLRKDVDADYARFKDYKFSE